MTKIARGALAIAALPLSLAALYLYAAGGWPWYAVLLCEIGRAHV